MLIISRRVRTGRNVLTPMLVLRSPMRLAPRYRLFMPEILKISAMIRVEAQPA